MATPYRPHPRSKAAILARHLGRAHGKHGLEPLTSEQLAERLGVGCYHEDYLLAHRERGLAHGNASPHVEGTHTPEDYNGNQPG